MLHMKPGKIRLRKTRSRAGTLFVLLFFCVIGVLLLPDRQKGEKTPRRATTAKMLAMELSRTPESTRTPTPTPKPTKTPRFTAVSPTATQMLRSAPTPTGTLPPGTTRVVKGLTEALQAIADHFMPIGADTCELVYHTIVGELRLVGTQEEQLSQLITITYPLTRIWNETSALENCTYSFRQTTPELFSLDPYLDRVKFVYMATVIDKYGAESMGLMLWIQINREQAEKIVWAKLSQCNIPLVVEVFRLHPSLSLRQAWTDLCP